MTPNTISRRSVFRLCLGSAVLLGVVIDHSSILKFQAQVQERKDTQVAKQEETTKEETRSKVATTDSQMALERAKSGCVTIELTMNNKPARLQNGGRVFDSQTFPLNPNTPRFDKDGNPINGVKPMPPGVVVCNEFGDTALVDNSGFLSKIYRVEPSKLQEFKGYLK